MDWRSKQNLIWQQVTASSKIGGSYGSRAFTESVITPFENEWDVLPAGRVKIIHSNGAVCPFEINISPNSPFTGIFKPGKVEGLIRLGGATDFTDWMTGGMVPGAGVKFFRSGRSSANVVLLNQLDPMPNGNHNFFAVPLTNHLSDQFGSFSVKLLAKKFCNSGHCITKVGLSDMSTFDQDGNQSMNPNFPFKITLQPTGQVNFMEN